MSTGPVERDVICRPVALSPDEVEAALSAEGFGVKRDHHDAPFGSWLIEIEHAPRLRLNFDGRDGWLSLEWETERLFSGMREWDPLWIGKAKSDRTAAMAVRIVRSAAEFADAARRRGA